MMKDVMLTDFVLLTMQSSLLTVFMLCHNRVRNRLAHEIQHPGLYNRTGKLLCIDLLHPIFTMIRAPVSM